MNVLEIITGLDVFEVLHLDCMIRNSNFITKLVATTLAPLGVLLCAFVWEVVRVLCVASRKGQRIVNGSAMTYSLIIMCVADRPLSPFHCR